MTITEVYNQKIEGNFLCREAETKNGSIRKILLTNRVQVYDILLDDDR